MCKLLVVIFLLLFVSSSGDDSHLFEIKPIKGGFFVRAKTKSKAFDKGYDRVTLGVKNDKGEHQVLVKTIDSKIIIDEHYAVVIGRKNVLKKKGAKRVLLCNSKNKTSIDITKKIALKYTGDLKLFKPLQIDIIKEENELIVFSFMGSMQGIPVVKLKWADIKIFDVVPVKEEDSEKTKEDSSGKNSSQDVKKGSTKGKDK